MMSRTEGSREVMTGGSSLDLEWFKITVLTSNPQRIESRDTRGGLTRKTVGHIQ